MRCCKIKCDKKNAWKTMNTIKKIAKKRSKNEWMQKGGCSSIMGCAENKREKEGQGRAFGPWTGFGLETGRVERVYKGGRPIFPHFYKIFLSLPLSRERSSLLSPSSPMGRAVVGSGGSGSGWPAGAAAPPRRNLKLVFFIKFFVLFSSTLSPLHNSKP